jgi:ubiquinone/menaquinone biosynthesis C-methylase UbiE
MADIEIVQDKNLTQYAYDIFLKTDLVLDIGGGRPYQGLDQYKEKFQNIRYYCLDFNPLDKPHIIGDAQALPFKSECTESIICKAVLEHLPEPHKVVDELYRILKPEGMIYLYLPFIFPYHDYKGDYYRFTEDSIQFLFRKFQKIELNPHGDYIFTTLRFMAGFSRGLQKFLLYFRRPLSFLARTYVSIRKTPLHGHEKTVTGYDFIVTK